MLKNINTLHSFHNFPTGSRQAVGICETILLESRRSFQNYTSKNKSEVDEVFVKFMN